MKYLALTSARRWLGSSLTGRGRWAATGISSTTAICSAQRCIPPKWIASRRLHGKGKSSIRSSAAVNASGCSACIAAGPPHPSTSISAPDSTHDSHGQGRALHRLDRPDRALRLDDAASTADAKSQRNWTSGLRHGLAAAGHAQPRVLKRAWIGKRTETKGHLDQRRSNEHSQQ